jgi:hypothetical protein
LATATPVDLERHAVTYWTRSLPKGGGGRRGEVHLESYTREERFLARWDQQGGLGRRSLFRRRRRVIEAPIALIKKDTGGGGK